MAKKNRFSEDDYQRLLDRAAGHGGASAPAKEGEPMGEDGEAPKQEKKRKGVSETPILSSIAKSSIFVEASEKHLVIAFSGARLFSLNELFAIQQYRKYIVFAYKKAWHAKTREALLSLGRRKPRFDGPCRITYFRQGSRSVDNDSLAVMFKYILDALKDDPPRDGDPGWTGVFRDDDPTIAIDDRKIQRPGGHLIAIRVDLLDEHPEGTDAPCSTLFQEPPANLELEPAARAKPAKVKTKKPALAHAGEPPEVETKAKKPAGALLQNKKALFQLGSSALRDKEVVHEQSMGCSDITTQLEQSQQENERNGQNIIGRVRTPRRK